MLIQQILLEVKNMISSLKSAGGNSPGNLCVRFSDRRVIKSKMKNFPIINFVF